MMTTMPVETPDSDLSTNEEGCADKQCCHNAAAATVARRETLTSRAKRIIGRPIDSPEKKKTKNQPKQPKEASSKRREQVLQAQRTHRQRTQGYIKELEKEVLALRDHEVKCKTATEQNELLLQRIAKLEDILRRNNIPLDTQIPPPLSLDVTQSMPLTPLGISSPYTNNDPILSPISGMSQTMTDLALTTPPASTSSLPSTVDANANFFINFDLSNFMPLQPDQFPGMLGHDEKVPIFSMPDTLDPCHEHITSWEDPELVSQQGTDFVLSLERLCLNHVDYDHYSGRNEQDGFSNALTSTNPQSGMPHSPTSMSFNNGGLGHAYSAIVNLLHAQRIAQQMHQQGLGTLELPKPLVEKMLHSTLHTDRSPSVTPYQIWANLVRIRSEGHDVCPEVVTLIQSQLQKYARCAGFGAAVDKDLLNQLLHAHFPGQYYKVTWSS